MKASTLMLALGCTYGALALAAEPAAKVSLIGRPVPSVDNLPNDHYGKLVREGHELATRTFAYIGPEVKDPRKRYAGNNLACVSCHQEKATKPYAMPWVGVSATFPQYRGREDEVSTVEERVNGCLERSMNGKPLPPDSREMKAFVTYIHFLSQGIPVGAEIEGAATKPSPPPNRRADLAAGEAVYKAQCAVCHGDNGQGVRTGKPGDALGYVFPPLWGPDSFNAGAGMNRLLMAARFIRHNMPQGANHGNAVLTDEQAYDVAGYMVSRPRPVKANLEADFPARWNKPVDAAFPPYVDGAPADQHKYGPFQPLIEMAKKRAAEHKAPQAAAAPAK
jgi:thiosulfate dehydrogenase